MRAHRDHRLRLHDFSRANGHAVEKNSGAAETPSRPLTTRERRGILRVKERRRRRHRLEPALEAQLLLGERSVVERGRVKVRERAFRRMLAQLGRESAHAVPAHARARHPRVDRKMPRAAIDAGPPRDRSGGREGGSEACVAHSGKLVDVD
jgi:hypothetical protein